jgi:hypothetical protein
VRYDSGLRVVQHGQLLHHQLRVTRSLMAINAAYEARAIRELIDLRADDIIINFNYDYYFVRELAPNAVIVTILNDDFVAEARWFSRSAARRQLAMTLRASDCALVVSYPLARQAREHLDAVSTFFPWSRSAYRQPPLDAERPDVLYWGFLNDRMRWDVFHHFLDAGVTLHIAGPVHDSPRSRKLLAHPNACYHGVADLSALAAVVNRSAATLLPYGMDSKYGAMVGAITINNRAFELLAAGLPLLYSDLPGLLEAPPQVISPCRSPADFLKAFRDRQRDFAQSQPVIREFLSGHDEASRYEQLMTVVQTARVSRTVSAKQQEERLSAK